MPENAENENAFGKIIAKAWRDPAFKAALIANPAATLKAEGVEVPSGITVSVLENTDKHVHLVLPLAPTSGLSDEELDAVAGGRRTVERGPGRNEAQRTRFLLQRGKHMQFIGGNYWYVPPKSGGNS